MEEALDLCEVLEQKGIGARVSEDGDGPDGYRTITTFKARLPRSEHLGWLISLAADHGTTVKLVLSGHSVEAHFGAAP